MLNRYWIQQLFALLDYILNIPIVFTFHILHTTWGIIFYFLTFCVSIANDIRQRSSKILFADISEILRQKQQLSVILVFCNLLSPTFISLIMSNPLQSESASSSINDSSSTNNLTVQQILDCNQNMVSAMTSAM